MAFDSGGKKILCHFACIIVPNWKIYCIYSYVSYMSKDVAVG